MGNSDFAPFRGSSRFTILDFGLEVEVGGKRAGVLGGRGDGVGVVVVKRIGVSVGIEVTTFGVIWGAGGVDWQAVRVRKRIISKRKREFNHSSPGIQQGHNT